MRLAAQVLQVLAVCAAAFFVAGGLARILVVDLFDLSIWFSRVPAVAAGVAGFVVGVRGAEGPESWSLLVPERTPPA